jgi:hypothetical protein
LNKIVDYPTTPPFASILLFLHSIAIYNTTALKRSGRTCLGVSQV